MIEAALTLVSTAFTPNVSDHVLSLSWACELKTTKRHITENNLLRCFILYFISLEIYIQTYVIVNYEILNKDGNIYIGLGNKKHKVEVLKDYKTPRITIGFDVTELNDVSHMYSFLPID